MRRVYIPAPVTLCEPGNHRPCYENGELMVWQITRYMDGVLAADPGMPKGYHNEKAILTAIAVATKAVETKSAYCDISDVAWRLFKIPIEDPKDTAIATAMRIQMITFADAILDAQAVPDA